MAGSEAGVIVRGGILRGHQANKYDDTMGLGGILIGTYVRCRCK